MLRISVSLATVCGPLATARGPSAKVSAIASLLAVIAVSVGCNKPERPHPGGPGMKEESRTKTVAVVPKVAATGDSSLLSEEQRKIVLAELGGGKTITLGDLETRLNAEPNVVKQQYATVAKRKEYLINWVQFEILADEARKQGMDQRPEVVEAIKQQMVRRYLRETVLDTIKAEDVTDEEIAAYYKNNLIMYQRPEQVEVRHMLFADEARAKQVLAELKTGSEGSAAKLNALWKDYVGRVSIDKNSVPYLGSLGRVSKEVPEHLSDTEKARMASIPKEVVEHAFLTEPYTLSGVVKSASGFHILLPVSKLPAVDKSLERVKKTVASRLLKRKRDLKRKELVEALREKSKIEVNEEAIRVLPTPRRGTLKESLKPSHAKQGGLRVQGGTK